MVFVSDSVCDIHGQNLKVLLAGGQYPVWEPQNSVSAIGRLCGSVGFIRPEPSALTPAKCEAVGMRVTTSKSEVMVLCQKRVACSLRVGSELLPQAKEFKYLLVLFVSEGKMGREG